MRKEVHNMARSLLIGRAFKIVTVSAGCLSVLASSGASAQTDNVEPLVIPDNVRTALAAAIDSPVTMPKEKLKKLMMDMVLSGKTTSHEWNIEYLPDGMLGINESSSGGSSKTSSSRLSLAGLVDPISSSDASASFGSASIMAGKAYVPFTIPSGYVTASVSSMIELSGQLKESARPGVNAKFEYRYATVTRRKSQTSGLFGRARESNLSNSYVVSCFAGIEKPATELHPALRGSYLPITCEHKNVKGPQSTQTFAYLVDSGLYVRASGVSERFQFEWKVTGAEY